MDAAGKAQRVIDLTRTNADLTGDQFDYWVSTEGWHEHGPFWLAAYELAKPRPAADAPLPATAEERRAAAAARKQAADALWAEVRPYVRAYYEGCRAATYTGWSKTSAGAGTPLRRVRRGEPITVPMAAALEQLGEAQRAVDAHAEQLEQRDTMIRQALKADVPVIAITKKTSLSRERIYQIRDNRR
jgi:hypothetical protein